MRASAGLYPLRFQPVYKDYLWGGERILRRFGRPAPPGVYAESWEVSDRAEGMSVVANGPLAGRTLRQLAAELGPELLGKSETRSATAFPLLIKLIDARERLSVQVHPDDQSARQYGGEAKTEMWYVLDTEGEAAVFAGLKPGLDREDVLHAIRDNSLPVALVRIPVAPGDAVFMPGGRVHAIDEGCLLLEVQQNSDTTYRLYDWDRVDVEGKARALHVEQALRVIRFDDPRPSKVAPRRLGFLGANELWELVSCPCFRTERMVLKEDWHTGCDGRTFHVLFVAQGDLELSCDAAKENLTAGMTCLIPAGVAGYQLVPREEAIVLRVTVP